MLHAKVVKFQHFHIVLFVVNGSSLFRWFKSNVCGSNMYEMLFHDALELLYTVGHCGVCPLSLIKPSVDALCTLFPHHSKANTPFSEPGNCVLFQHMELGKDGSSRKVSLDILF